MSRAGLPDAGRGSAAGIRYLRVQLDLIKTGTDSEGAGSVTGARRHGSGAGVVRAGRSIVITGICSSYGEERGCGHVKGRCSPLNGEAGWPEGRPASLNQRRLCVNAGIASPGRNAAPPSTVMSFASHADLLQPRETRLNDRVLTECGESANRASEGLPTWLT
jgi:hypothetical protein